MVSLEPFVKDSVFSSMYVFDNFVYKLGIFEGLESVECGGTSDSMYPLEKQFPSHIQP